MTRDDTYMKSTEIMPEKIQFRVSSTSGFTTGFTVVITVNGQTAGTYRYSNTDEGAYHDVEVSPAYRGRGLGRLLTLKAIRIASDYDDIGGYVMGALGHTQAMDQVYRSLMRDGLVDGGLGELHLTAAGEEYLESHVIL